MLYMAAFSLDNEAQFPFAKGSWVFVIFTGLSMVRSLKHFQYSSFGRVVCLGLAAAVLWSGIFPTVAAAQAVGALPAPVGPVFLDKTYNPLLMKGIKAYANEPFRFDLLLDKGESGLSGEGLQTEITRLSRFFIASLAVPDQDMWVNLSPYEKDRIIPDAFGTTEMGKVLLEQDYLLKQTAAALTYPETSLGAKFWTEVYRRVNATYGTSDVPVGMVNKVWIIPAQARVYTKGDSVFVTHSELDVLTDADYQALRKGKTVGSEEESARIYTAVYREMVLPELRREVNSGKIFAPVRQVYNALILATWYKRHWAQGVLGASYVGRNKVRGIDDVPLAWRNEVFERYVRSTHEGVYSYIKEEADGSSGDVLPRKYFSGGVMMTEMMLPGVYAENGDMSQVEVGSGMVRAPLFLDRAEKTTPPLAVGGKFKRLLRTGALSVLLALGGLSLLPSGAQAATFAPSSDGRSTVVTLEKGETLGGALEQMRLAFKKQDPQAYQNSSVAGRMWGAQGAVARAVGGVDADHVAPGVPLTVKAVIPQAVLAGLPQKSVSAEAPQSMSAKTPALEASVPVAEKTVPVAGKPAHLEQKATPVEQNARPVEQQAAAPDRVSQAWAYILEKVSSAKNTLPRIDLSVVDWHDKRIWGAAVLLALGGLYTFSKKGRRQAPVAPQSKNAPAAPEVLDQDVTVDETVDHLAALEAMVSEAKGEPAAGKSTGSGDTDLIAMDSLLAAAKEQLAQVSPAAGVSSRTDLKKPGRSWPLMNSVINALIIGFWTAGLSGPWHAAVMLISFIASWVGSTWLGASVPDGTLRCGIVGLLRFAPEGTEVREMDRKLAKWMERMTRTLEDRGGQQMGMFTFAREKRSAAVLRGVKTLKNKRGVFWRDGNLVFYPDVVGDMVKQAFATVPAKARTLFNFGKGTLGGFVTHVRYATGGEIMQDAAHPHKSPLEIKKIYAFDVDNNFASAVVPVQVLAGHNGDNDAVRMGGQDGARLDVAGMRRFFPAAAHMYYEGKVTPRYLRKNIDELLPGHRSTIDYGRVLKALKAAGYVEGNKVSPRFVGLDDVWRQQFPEYGQDFFALVESALYGLPPGDSPVIPLEVRLLMGQGDWESSLRYAHYMVGHPDGKGLQEDILFEDDQKTAGAVMDRVFDKAKEHLIRASFKLPGGEKSLADCWFSNDEKARKAGAGDQRLILDKFEELVALQMRHEIRTNSAAGRIFSSWEKRWQDVYGDVAEGRRLFIAAMVRKFFTGDREHAVRELATRANGTYGVFVRTTVGDDGVTVLCNQQDVVVGFNRVQEVLAFASDPRTLKTEGPNGERLTDVLHLRDGEVADLRFSPQGKFQMRVWQKGEGVLPEAGVAARVYPTARLVAGELNPYFAPPPVAYKHRREMVAEDLDNMPAILNKARQEWDDPQSFNRQSAAYLAERLADVKRLVVLGYDNSYTVTDMLKPVLSGLVAGLKVESFDTNDFINDPDIARIDKDTVVLVVSKSGATFATNLSAKLLMKMTDRENVFCTTARIDSVLNTVIGQGLHPDDPFTRRIFLTGEFYPSEAPVVSEQLLLYQHIRLVLQLAQDLAKGGNPLGVTIPSEDLEKLASTIVEGMKEDIREAVGRDETGYVYDNDWGRRLRKIGDDLGWNFLRPWLINRSSDVFVWGIFRIGAPVAGLIALAGAGMVTVPYLLGLLGITATLDWLFTKYGFPFLVSEILSRWKGFPKNGRTGARKLFVAAPPHIAKTQRNFFSRLFANGLASTSPAAIYDVDPTRGLVTEHASDVARGDIFLNFVLEHSMHRGAMSLRQATFPKTGALGGMGLLKGRAAHEDVVVTVPEVDDPRSQAVIDATLGQFGLMLAAKVVGVTMAMRASFRGRLWNPAESWSRAGVHTTPTPTGVTPRAVEILASSASADPDASQGTLAERTSVTPGGIDFDSRRIVLEETAEPAAEAVAFAPATDIPLEGFVPRVGIVVALAPAMSLAAICVGE